MRAKDGSLVIAVSLLIGGGCIDNEPTGPRAGGSTARFATVVSDEGDLQAVDRFTISLHANGSFQPGKSIDITVDVQSNLPTTDAELQVILPEVEAAKLSGWGETFSYRTKEKLPPALSRRQPFSRGARLSERITVSIPTPGYYRVVATVASKGDPELVEAGQWIRNGAVIERWLLVTESGGMLTDDFEPARVPDGKVKTTGPFRSKPTRRNNPYEEPAMLDVPARGPSARVASQPPRPHRVLCNVLGQ